MKLYYNTKGYGTGDNKSVFTIMSDDNILMWNIDLSNKANINGLVAYNDIPWYNRPIRFPVDDFIFICNFTKSIDLHTIKYIYPEFFL